MFRVEAAASAVQIVGAAFHVVTRRPTLLRDGLIEIITKWKVR